MLGGIVKVVIINKLKSIFGLALIILTVGCGAKTSGSGVDQLIGQEPTNCDDAGFSEGKAADFELLSQNQTEITNFGKQFHSNILDAVQGASASQTLMALKTFNFPIYKGPGKNCKMFQTLPNVSNDHDADEAWKRQNTGLPEGQAVLGLYLGIERFKNGQFVQEPKMIIKSDTNRWTLVHEMMHFLFHKWEVEEGVSNMKHDADERRAYAETQTALKVFNTSSRASDFKKFVISYDKLMQLAHESNKRGPLEESAVEDTLAERFTKGLLTFVPAEDAADNWYLASNLQKSAGFYQEQLKDVGAEELNANGNKKLAAEIVAQIEIKLNEIDKQLSDMVVDSPEKEAEREALSIQRTKVADELVGYQESLAIASKTIDFLVGVLDEMQALYDKSEVRKHNAPVDPYVVFAKISNVVRSFNRAARIPSASVVGCSFSNREVRHYSFHR